MTGGQYRYELADIHVSKHADAETMSDTNSHLTVFVKITSAFEYYILRYNIKQ